ncbi:MAG TPA: hypothetical protein VG458_07975 [Solirubrobacterales bacterium]|nr:hypothetical protein [Solirubrobacterales bacterium]
MGESEDFASAVKSLDAFLGQAPLTDSIGNLERALEDSSKEEIRVLLNDAAVTPGLLQAAMLVRSKIGRISDVIHATAIALALVEILEPDEVLRRPSLGAGNDKSRPFDLETSHRVAEFKLAGWKGADAMRKRQTFKDLVHLAAESSNRKAELYVLGLAPIQFLKTCNSAAAWGLDRFSATRKLFEAHFGSLDMAIADFTNGPAAHVKLIDLEERLPQLFRPCPDRRAEHP